LRGTPAQFVGIVYDQPDEQSATKKGHRGVQGPGQSAQPADRATAGLIAVKRARFEPDLLSAWI
jgi:hypothetical protein